MDATYQRFQVRAWQPDDRQAAFTLIRDVLAEYGLGCEPQGADQDVWEVEQFYHQTGGEFWVVEQAGAIVGTAAFYPVAAIAGGQRAVEIRKMYLHPTVRGQGLGRWLLAQLEVRIQTQGYDQIRIETASVLKTAVQLYERSGYQPDPHVETTRCDRAYVKSLSPLSLDG